MEIARKKERERKKRGGEIESNSERAKKEVKRREIVCVLGV